MQQLFSLDLLKLHGDALAALARAEERVALSPRPNIMKAQLRLLEQEALGFVEGKLVSPATLELDYGHSHGAIRQWPYEFANLFGRSLPPGKPPTADAMVQWLMANNVLRDSADTDATPKISLDVIHHRISAWHRQTKADCALPRLVAGADLAAKWLMVSPLTRGNAVTGVMIGDLYATARSRLSAGGVAAIGMKRQQIYWMRAVGGDDDDDLKNANQVEAWRRAWLSSMTEGARAILELDDRLRRYWHRVESSSVYTRKSSRMRDLVDLVARRPSITVRAASESLGVSRQAAHMLIQAAEAALLLRETTHGQSFRRYVAAF